MWVSGVDLLQELVAVFCLLDDEGDIHILELLALGVGGQCFMALV